ncbi:uncharacterized protein L969DRAFT_56834 [Mixia osmundae IAM 14324]|uniref:Homeobox domain-containing protein n=2 Tax=Mixia osmundae TaxID=34349 RepID=G7EAJ9_MIXOS|nr:uncharacterized protein L969DRAFT_56834 [Mixia osmundae IAM 14324]KEI42349.1 hypothetical protein L969DRAFT_56834 [Mixia osmundae IAM 14324]GAA99859.1 hypothetical protein E5Q_06562 [Mixia osmundae IAM 14324]
MAQSTAIDWAQLSTHLAQQVSQLPVLSSTAHVSVAYKSFIPVCQPVCWQEFEQRSFRLIGDHNTVTSLSKALSDCYDDAVRDIRSDAQVSAAKIIAIADTSHDSDLSKLAHRLCTALEDRAQAEMHRAVNLFSREGLKIVKAAYARPTPAIDSTGTFNPRVAALLEAAWQQSNKLTPAEKECLAAATGLKSRQVSVWFANARQRRKRAGSAKQPQKSAYKPAKYKSTCSDDATDDEADADWEAMEEEDEASPEQETPAPNHVKAESPSNEAVQGEYKIANDSGALGYTSVAWSRESSVASECIDQAISTIDEAICLQEWDFNAAHTQVAEGPFIKANAGELTLAPYPLDALRQSLKQESSYDELESEMAAYWDRVVALPAMDYSPAHQFAELPHLGDQFDFTIPGNAFKCL